ncbi:cryptic family protein 1B [Tenrec ecaudatus]|uniref:cryptic family protein 1B n=1 Tax=Tenrec ecaudatus TaxID=94439 RepID=UPI003F5909DC
MALQIIPMGNSYQREKHEGDKERISNVTTQSHQQKSLNWIFNNFSDVTEGWRQEPDSLPHFWGLQKAPWPRCCLNGGTCILGSFCVCPSHFTGRHCEQDLRRRECGALAHGAWIVLSCRLCRCVYGALHCLSRQTQGFCGPSPFLGLRGDSPLRQLNPCLPIRMPPRQSSAGDRPSSATPPGRPLTA